MTKTFKKTNFSRNQLLAFVLVFAAIGGYLLFRSFAASPLVASLEAEQMALPGGASIVNDTSASGGKAIQLTANSSTTGTVSFSASVSSFTVIAKGTACKGSPTMSVALDGKTYLSNLSVNSTAWASYTATPAAAIASGTHSLALSFTNAYTFAGHGKKSNGACSRVLSLDTTNFFGVTAPPPPAPTVSLSASPSSVSAGQSSTLTWNSSNSTSCTASGAWSGSQPLSGSTSTGALNQSSTYSLTCTGGGGNATASATVNVNAVTTPNIYLTPASQSLAPGGSIVMEVHENSGSTAVNAVQANFSYPANLLTFVSADATASPFTVTAQSSGGSGQVQLGRGIVGSLTGDQLVSKVTFQAGSSTGAATLAFVSGTQLDAASNNTNIITSLSMTIGSTLNIQ